LRGIAQRPDRGIAVACDIELEIGAGPGPDEYTVHVVRSLAGGEPTATLRLDVDRLLQDRVELETTVLASAVAARRVVPVNERQMRQVGEQLFQALFAGPIYGSYRASMGAAQRHGELLRVVLRLTAPKLAAIPWEALFDPETGAYICRKEPLVRHVPAPYTPEPLEVLAPLRVLGLVASPRNLPPLDVSGEQRRLSEALAEPIAEELIELNWLPQASWHGVQAKLLSGQWHVLHFVGHGDYDEETDQGQIALVNTDGRADLVEADALADLLGEAQPTPRLVVLNSCSSGEAGTQDVFSGTAAALVRSGISAVAAMQFAVSDDAALAFARGFYTSLANGRGIDEATRSGRIAILGAHGTLEWVTPVLYLRGETTKLFNLRTLQRPEQATRDLQRPIRQGPPSTTEPTAAADITADVEYAEALAAFFAGRWTEAVRQLEALHERYPDEARVRDRLEEAQRKRDLAGWFDEAEAATKRNDWTAAIDRLERVYRVDPTYRDTATRLEQARTALLRQSRFDEITALHQAGRWRAVLAAGEELDRLDPDHPDPDGMLAHARVEVAEADLADRYNEAIRMLDEEQWRAAEDLLSRIQMERDDYRDTRALLATAKVRTLYAKGRAEEAERHWVAAFRYYEAALTIDPEHRDTQSRLESCAYHEKIDRLDKDLRHLLSQKQRALEGGRQIALSGVRGKGNAGPAVRWTATVAYSRGSRSGFGWRTGSSTVRLNLDSEHEIVVARAGAADEIQVDGESVFKSYTLVDKGPFKFTIRDGRRDRSCVLRLSGGGVFFGEWASIYRVDCCIVDGFEVALTQGSIKRG
jgi:tetratricopeptide (TPR) repeat protein